MQKRFIPAQADTRVTFVCSDRTSRFEWTEIDNAAEPIVAVDNLFHALQLLGGEGADYGWEVSRVIVDQDVAELGFLEFLSHVPHSFRGDILFIANSRRAFLSAVGRQEGRVLYALTPADLDFYLATMLIGSGSTSSMAFNAPPNALSVAC